MDVARSSFYSSMEGIEAASSLPLSSSVDEDGNRKHPTLSSMRFGRNIDSSRRSSSPSTSSSSTSTTSSSDSSSSDSSSNGDSSCDSSLSSYDDEADSNTDKVPKPKVVIVRAMTASPAEPTNDMATHRAPRGSSYLGQQDQHHATLQPDISDKEIINLLNDEEDELPRKETPPNIIGDTGKLASAAKHQQAPVRNPYLPREKHKRNGKQADKVAKPTIRSSPNNDTDDLVISLVDSPGSNAPSAEKRAPTRDDVSPFLRNTEKVREVGSNTRNASRERDRGVRLSSPPPSSNHENKAQSDPTALRNNNKQADATLQPTSSLETAVVGNRVSPEINPQVYLQQVPQESPRQPILHKMTLQSRLLNRRQKISVNRVFVNPICDMWKSKFESFNHMQSELAGKVADTDDNVVISAPTGAGKTAVFEIAMARLFCNDLRENYQPSPSKQLVSKHKKIVYVAPSKALCEERHQDWSVRLAQTNLGIECAMITGDAEDGASSFSNIASAHLILTTPEKWDSLSRKWTEHFYLFASVKLILLDEVHLLGDGSRGCCLESIVCRMKTIQRTARAIDASAADIRTSSYAHTTPEAVSSLMRIVAVSATLPNLSDIASFLGANECFSFDSSYRPVPLTTHVVGLGYVGKNQFMFSKSLNRHVPDLFRRFSKGRPSIVFCHTKKETETLAAELSSTKANGSRGVQNDAAGRTKVVGLQKCLLRGFAYHHAGLDASDRKLVERAFADGNISCLCATSTLAMGVNLPAHLVIVKGTSAWRGGGQQYQEIDRGQLLQMIGRAGRPGYDTSGTAVIMTDNASKRRYEQLSGGLQIVESQLPKKLVEVFNSEVSQHVVTSSSTAMDWIKGTFFYCRARSNPSHYGMGTSARGDFDSQFEGLVSQSLRKLNDEGLVSIHNEGSKVVPLKACHVMSSHMVDFDAMKKIARLPHDAGQLELLNTLSEIEGLHRPVRRLEKKLLNEAHKVIKYQLGGPPSKVRIQTPSQKAFVLLQAAIGQHYFEDYTLRQEMSSTIEYATRMLTAIEDYSVDGTKHGYVALQSLRLRRSLATSLWGNDGLVLNQLRGVGPKTAAKLRFNNITSFQDVLKSSAQDIERAAGRSGGFGNELRGIVSKILQRTLQISANVELDDNSNPKEVVCTFVQNRKHDPLLERCDLSSNKANSGRIVSYALAVHTDRPGGCLMFLPNIADAGEYRFPCPSKFGRIYVHAVSNLAGLDESITLDGNDTVLKSNFTLPPAKAAENAKPHKRTSAATDNATLHSTFRQSVQGVGDFRINNKGSSRKKKQGKLNRKKKPPSTGSNGKHPAAVTPTPGTDRSRGFAVAKEDSQLPISSSSYGSTARNSKKPADNSVSPRSVPSIVSAGTIGQGNSNSARILRKAPRAWIREKSEQSKFQDRAFHRKKENPFAMFKYDPNDIESTLDRSITIGEQERGLENEQSSIIPPSALVALRQASVAWAQHNPLTGSSLRTPGSKRSFDRMPTTGRRKKRAISASRVPEQDLLQMKAMEHQAHAQAAIGRRHLSPMTSEPDNFTAPTIPLGAPMASRTRYGLHAMHPNMAEGPSLFPQNHHLHDNIYHQANMIDQFAAPYAQSQVYNEFSRNDDWEELAAMAGQESPQHNWQMHEETFPRGDFGNVQDLAPPYSYEPNHQHIDHIERSRTEAATSWEDTGFLGVPRNQSSSWMQQAQTATSSVLTQPITASHLQSEIHDAGFSLVPGHPATPNRDTTLSDTQVEDDRLLEEAFFSG